MLQVSDQKIASVALREHAFSGVTIDAAKLKVRGRLGGLIGAVRRFTRNIMLLNAPAGLSDPVLKTAGVTHATRSDLETEAPPLRPDVSAQA